ncbi:MAG: hypothetical protein IPL99_15075 [Candidatus Competibacteraceae bacterium]|nr:hypothetical protein [Candidatus Competibacteraceae bacterium]
MNELLGIIRSLPVKEKPSHNKKSQPSAKSSEEPTILAIACDKPQQKKLQCKKGCIELKGTMPP